MAPSNSHGYQEESHAIALARTQTRSRNRSVAAAENEKAAAIEDVESLSDAEGIVEERDFKHKQASTTNIASIIMCKADLLYTY